MRSIKKVFSIVILVGFITCFCIFAFQNAEYISVRFLEYRSPEVPLFIIILGFLVTGVFITGMFSVTEVIRLGAKVRKQEKKIAELNNQLTEMKQRPLLDDFSETNQNTATDTEVDAAEEVSG